MIIKTQEYDTYEEALEGFDNARIAWSVGYGFYPKPASFRGDHPFITVPRHDGEKYSFTYSRGSSAD